MPFTTRVVFNVLTDEEGNPVAGEKVKATLKFPQLSRDQQSEVIPQTVETVTDANGRWELALIPNDQLDDPLSYYQIQEGSDGKPWTHYHAVRIPSGTGAVWLGDVLLPEAPDSPQLVAVLHNLVSSIRAEDNAPLKGDVQLVAGTGIQLNQDYNSRKIEISSVGGGAAHNLLNASAHTDTSTTAVARGMLVVGKLVAGVIKWAGLALGLAGKVLKSDGTDVFWGNVDRSEITNFEHTHSKADITDFAHTHSKADLPATTVYTDQANTFTAGNQQIDTTLIVPRKGDPATPVPGEVWVNGKELKYRDNQATSATQTVEIQSNKGVPNGYASLDAAGTVPLAQIPNTLTGKDADTVDGFHGADLEKVANKGVANGYASLDANGRVPDAQLGTGTPTATNALLGNRTWGNPAPAPHTHTKADVTDLETITVTPTANAVPKADANGDIDAGWIPANVPLVVEEQTLTSYTYTLADGGKLKRHNNTAAITVTVPTNASVPFPIGTRIFNEQMGTGQVTFTGAAGVTLLEPDNHFKTRARHSFVTLIKVATDTWLVVGDTTA